MKEDDDDVPLPPIHERRIDEPVLAINLIRTARLWAVLYPAEAQEVRDHIALRVVEELGSGPIDLGLEI